MKFRRLFETEEQGRIVREKLSKVERLPPERNWLSDHEIKNYGNEPGEVHVKHGLGLKMVGDLNRERNLHGSPDHQYPPKDGYDRAGIQKVPLADMHYHQPSVNAGKLVHMATHYHPDPEKVHRNDGLREYDLPWVNKYQGGPWDGAHTTPDHHRLIACHLRGDTHTLARVALHKWSGKEYRQIKTPTARDGERGGG